VSPLLQKKALLAHELVDVVRLRFSIQITFFAVHPVRNSLIIGSSVQVWTRSVNISARYIGYSWLYNHFVPLLGIDWSGECRISSTVQCYTVLFPTCLVVVQLFGREVAFVCCCYIAELDVYSCIGQSPVACLCCLLSLWAKNANPYCCVLRRRYWHAAVRWCLGGCRLDIGYLGLFKLRICIIHYYMHYAIWSWSSHRCVTIRFMAMWCQRVPLSLQFHGELVNEPVKTFSVGKLVACLKAGFNAVFPKFRGKCFFWALLLWTHVTHLELYGQKVDIRNWTL
jgi:hypothetical protein